MGWPMNRTALDRVHTMNKTPIFQQMLDEGFPDPRTIDQRIVHPTGTPIGLSPTAPKPKLVAVSEAPSTLEQFRVLSEEDLLTMSRQGLIGWARRLGVTAVGSVVTGKATQASLRDHLLKLHRGS